MKKRLRITLGIINILASINMLFFYFIFMIDPPPAYKLETRLWGQLLLILAILALISGRSVLKEKNMRWTTVMAIASPILAGLMWLVFFGAIIWLYGP